MDELFCETVRGQLSAVISKLDAVSEQVDTLLGRRRGDDSFVGICRDDLDTPQGVESSAEGLKMRTLRRSVKSHSLRPLEQSDSESVRCPSNSSQIWYNSANSPVHGSLPGEMPNLSERTIGSPLLPDNGIGESLAVVPLPKRRPSEVSLAASDSSGSKSLQNAFTPRLAKLLISKERKRSACQKYIWTLLEDPVTIPGGQTCMGLISFLIILSDLLFILMTVDPPLFNLNLIDQFQRSLDVIFLVEVLVRFYCCPNRVRFSLAWVNILDITSSSLAIATWIITWNDSLDTRSSHLTVTFMCVCSVLRLLKLVRRFQHFFLIIEALKLAYEALPVLMFILGVIVLMFSSLIFVIEPRENIPSMPVALWFTIVTVGTIGYGDITPETWAGSIIVCVLIIVSALYMAIPIGIVGQAFSTIWEDREKLMLVCRVRNCLLQSGYRADDITEVFALFDKDDNRVVELNEFVSLMNQLQVGAGKERYERLFTTLDTNKNGTIDCKEFVKALFPKDYSRLFPT